MREQMRVVQYRLVSGWCNSPIRKTNYSLIIYKYANVPIYNYCVFSYAKIN